MGIVNIIAQADGTLQAQIPDFALEDTLAKVSYNTGMTAQILKQMVTGEKLNARILKQLADNSKTQTEEAKKQSATRVQFGGSMKDLTNATKDVESAMKLAASGVTSLTGMLQKSTGVLGSFIDGVAQAGAVAAGFIGGSVDEFIKQSRLLSKEVGFITSPQGGLMKLRIEAGKAGLFMGDLTSAVQQSGTALAGLADPRNGGIANGILAFSNLSREFQRGTRQFGNFGLSVEELNQLLVQELDIRRQAGLTDGRLQRDSNTALQRILREATALADLTGRSRQDILAGATGRSSALSIFASGGLSETQMRNLSTGGGILSAFLPPEIASLLDEGIRGNLGTGGRLGNLQALRMLDPNLAQTSMFLQSQTGVGLDDLMAAAGAGDANALQSLLTQLSTGIQGIRGDATLRALAGQEVITPIINLGNSLSQTADRLNEGNLADILNNINTTDREINNLQLVPNTLRRAQTALITELQTAAMGPNGLISSGPEGIGAVVNSTIDTIMRTMGIDAANLGNADRTSLIAGLAGVGFLTAAQKAELGIGGGEGGGMGIGGAVASGAAGGLAAKGGIKGMIRAGVGIAGNTMRFAFGGLPGLVLTGALIGVIGKSISEVQEAMTESKIKKQAAPSVAKARDILSAQNIGFGSRGFEMSDVIDNLANHLNDTGMRVQDLSHDQITQMLLESAQRVRVNNASRRVTNIMPNMPDDVRRRQAHRNNFLGRFGQDADLAEMDAMSLLGFVGDGSGGAGMKRLTESFSKNAQVYMEVLKNPSAYEPETVMMAINEVSNAMRYIDVAQSLIPGAGKFQNELQEQINTLKDAVAIANVDNISANAYGNYQFTEKLAQRLGNISFSEADFASAGITDPATKEAILDLEQKIQATANDRIDTTDIMLGKLDNVNFDSERLREVANDRIEMIKVLQEIKAALDAGNEISTSIDNRQKKTMSLNDY